MSVITFRCPHCAADLKTRDDHISANPVSCPDCRKPIVITRDEFGNVAATVPPPPAGVSKSAKTQKTAGPGKAAPPPGAKPQSAPIVREERPQPDSKEQSGKTWLSRKAIAWIGASVAAVAMVAVATIFAWPRGSHTAADTKNDTTQQGKVANSIAAMKTGAAGLAPSSRSDQAAGTKDKAIGPPTVNSRLTNLGQRIAEYRVKQGHFPSAALGSDGLPPAERLSWLAQLVATVLQPNRPAPVWTESWRSTRNDRFVRQQIPEFLNPSIPKVTGAENYPTTHFAGVAGVGTDAADLPIGNPRAGIFGNGRSTRLQDIRDGASNTLMVVGVTGDLGSWAASGTPSVRAFTREPYVNGPDGIGTGSPDRMLVLKADGSVQEFSSKTDPRVLRRMAAMADGLPLDPKIPGEPGEKSPPPLATDLTAMAKAKMDSPGVPGAKAADSVPKAADPAGPRAPVAASRPAAKKPAKVPAAPAPKINVPAALAQRVVRFEQVKPVPLRDVLNWMEDLVPIRGDRHEIPDLDDLMQTPISLQLENTTVGALLEAVLAPAGLKYRVQPDAVQLQRLEPASGRPASP
ncbi:MAG TPA: DUF1559 domain-containing protein [Planctomycetaceae bacterium]|jgi:hypothetical protein|nr:DUF1559 domain-containing protein [Planctomycetaceae bacterium]